MGINFGLRCGDLISLRVGDVVAPNGEFVSTFRIIEEKTGKVRAMAMNGSVIHALRLYIDNRYGTRPVDRRDFLFTSESNNKRKYNGDLKAPASRYSEEAGNIPLTVRSAERILKKIVNDECNITVHASTHMLLSNLFGVLVDVHTVSLPFKITLLSNRLLYKNTIP